MLLSLRTAALVRPSPDLSQILSPDKVLGRDTAGRGVWFLAGCQDVGWSQVALQAGPDGIHNKYFVLHSWLMVEGSSVDGPLKIEISVDKSLDGQPDSERYNIRVFDLTPAQSQKVIAAKAGKVAYKVGTTDLTNKDFLDPDRGKGVVPDAWNADNTYRNGMANANQYDFDENPPKLEKQNLNTCHTFLQRLVGKLNLAMGSAAEAVIQYSSIASGMREAKNDRFQISNVYRDIAGSDASKNTRTAWRMNTEGKDFQTIGDKNAVISENGGNFDQMCESADLYVFHSWTIWCLFSYREADSLGLKYRTDPATGQPMESDDAINIDEAPLTDPPSHPNGEVGPNQSGACGSKLKKRGGCGGGGDAYQRGVAIA